MANFTHHPPMDRTKCLECGRKLDSHTSYDNCCQPCHDRQRLDRDSRLERLLTSKHNNPGSKEIPTHDEMAETYNSLMAVANMYSALYGTPCKTINKVVRFWGRLGLRELDKIEAAKYEPRMPLPTFPVYDENCNIIG